jgi:ParB-like chromosome segregation protein Spo0J
MPAEAAALTDRQPEIESPEITFPASVEALGVLSGIRDAGLDEEHVQRLVEAGGNWPAILVWETEATVLDGAHRLEAAKRLEMTTILAVGFRGGWQEAYLEAVRRNVAHGLPLTLRERTRAARQLLDATPEWSDRRLALACGLSPKTVARLRREASARGGLARAEVRVGRDGRTRPVSAETVRDRIASALAEQPDSSLRAIAEQVGASPETVRNVRRDLQGARSRPPERSTRRLTVPATVLSLVTSEPDRVEWGRDRALSSGPLSVAFLKWFKATDMTEEWFRHVPSVPLSRVYEVADEARRRARLWQDFAEAVEGRVRHRVP